MHNVGIINLNFSNSKSFTNILESLKLNFGIIDHNDQIKNYKKIILPGTGSFDQAMRELRDKKMDQMLLEHCNKGNYLLGVCLGMQVLFSEGEEGGYSKGLGLINGKVKKLLSVTSNKDIIHIGWNEVRLKNNILIFDNISLEENFYFVHGFHVLPEEKINFGETKFDENIIVSVVQKNNIYGIQFHPEKSHLPGKKILNNFFNL